MEISEKIKKIRKKAKLTQEQFAEKINVSRNAVAKWETNKAIPESDNIVAISETFNITTDELLKDKYII